MSKRYFLNFQFKLTFPTLFSIITDDANNALSRGYNELHDETRYESPNETSLRPTES